MRRSAIMGSGILVFAALLAGRGAASAQEGEPHARLQTREAGCVLRITCDARLLPVNADMLIFLLGTPVVSDEPAGRLLGISTDDVKDYYELEFCETGWQMNDDEGTLLGHLVVTVSQHAPPVARALLREICSRLQATLRSASEVDQARLRERLEMTENELERETNHFAQLRELEQQLCARAGRGDLSRADIAGEIKRLEVARQDAEMELFVAHAREKAVSEQIAKIGREVKESTEKSGVAVELQKVIELREKQVERLQLLVEDGRASSQDLDQVQIEIAQARAQLARYREEASQAAGGGLLANLNKELIEVAIESAEQKVRLSSMQARLDEIRNKGLLELADRYEREVEMQLALAERAVRELSETRHELQRRLQNLRPAEVTTIGGE